jgi:hypothetical protein
MSALRLLDPALCCFLLNPGTYKVTKSDSRGIPKSSWEKSILWPLGLTMEKRKLDPYTTSGFSKPGMSGYLQVLVV